MARNRTRARSSSLFLLELIIAIVFFAAASAVCVQLFARSHSLSIESQQLNAMTNEASAAAEIVYNSDSMDDAVTSLETVHKYNEIKDTENGKTVEWFYDKDLTNCESAGAEYVISIDLHQEDHLLKADINCVASDDDKPIFRQPVEHAVSGKEAE